MFASNGVLISDTCKCLPDELCLVLINFAAQSNRAKSGLHGRRHYSTGSMLADIDPLQPAIKSSLP
jgi:hypothetical protein